ncbi:MAG TPA: DNA internalization-related competence protein ComEC/Rec2 [Candidatus Binataceae bacterium]|nr:DNA internalization-related competence protein ComEC/Rec2 [Candidatus Binataceae bacterium]
MLQTHRATSRIRTWAAAVPPLYLVTTAVLAGDLLGNCHCFVPFTIALTLVLASALLFSTACPLIATAVALASITAGATIPVHALLEPPPDPSTFYRFDDGAIVTLEGWLIREPERSANQRTFLFVAADRAGLAQSANPAESVSALSPVHGTARVTVVSGSHFAVGDELRVTGALRFPRNDGDPGEFDYRGWTLRQGLVAEVYAEPRKHHSTPVVIIGHREAFPAARIQRVRDHIGAFIDANLPEPERSEMRALIIGDRSGIGEPLRQRFALTGMAHLLVISGLHLGIVAGAAFMAMRFMLWRTAPTLMASGYASKLAAATAALAAIGYSTIAGHHVSTTRALVMVLAYMGAIMIDRSREFMASLVLAALIICLAMPGSTADIGFQLSFFAVGAILIGMRRFSAWWRWRYVIGTEPNSTLLWRAREGMAQYVAISFWAMVGTAPLTGFYFNQFAIVGLAANAIVVPIMGFGCIICGLIASMLSFICMPAARVPLWLAGECAALGNVLAGWFEHWPCAWFRIFTPTIPELLIAYGLLGLWITRPLAGTASDPSLGKSFGGRHPAIAPARRMTAIVLLIALAADAGYWTFDRCFRRDLRITFLSVGEGDAAVVRFPGSRVMLIDGGGAFGGTFDPGERLVAPYLWSQKIMRVDYVVVSHPDRDHFGGLTFIARNFRPREFWTGGTSSDNDSYQELVEAMDAAGAQSNLCNAVAPTETIGGVTMRCLWSAAALTETKDNNESVVLRLDYRGKAILFPGDLEAKAERELIATGADVSATILKVPHHGSITSSSAGFLEAVAPHIAVMSLGYHNRFHFPAPAVLQRYRDAGIPLLRTDQVGAVFADVNRAGSLSISTFNTGPIGLPVGH